ncbi:hypothetical protein AB9P05_21580 [Roseivirga sp. BDSF3-8]|uniref:hypothetical protein n=1 Tax=Roseivirga sp. BDSF3-8 TaxID=3241598 RepID=UPI0035324E64
MLKTEYGSFDGDKWERLCQICFKHKYEEQVYLEMKASPGDYGIEGFTRTGKAFQCYCPNEHYTKDELYKKQLKKITDDLNKLKIYEKQLKKRLGDTLIKRWYFVTPEYSKNEIVAHSTKKRDELRKLKLSIIDNNNFEVIPTDIDFLSPYLSTALGITNHKLDISPNKPVSEEEGLVWKGKEISLVENAQRKHQLRFPSHTNGIERKVDILTEKSIKHFLNGNFLLNKWENDYPEDFEKFLRIKSQFEEKVIEICIFPTDNNNGRLNEIESSLFTKVKDNFPFLEDTMITNLCNQVMADWIMRCPIDFE